MISDDALKAAQEYGDKIGKDIYFYNGTVDESGLGELIKCSIHKHHKNAMLVMVTYGGLANSAYRISRFLQNLYGSFTMFIPSFCKSAGTLVAVGAHKLIMSNFAELGPLDVQLYKADEIGERRSGLIARSAIESLNEQAFDLFEHFMFQIKFRSSGQIRFKMASELAAQVTVGLLSPIYGQINPDNVGEDHRNLLVARKYGELLEGISKNTKPDAVRKLVEDFPSHDFVIDKGVATDLFERIEDPNRDLYSLMALLGEAAFRPMTGGACVKMLTARKAEKQDAEDGGRDEDGAQAGQAEPVHA